MAVARGLAAAGDLAPLLTQIGDERAHCFALRAKSWDDGSILEWSGIFPALLLTWWYAVKGLACRGRLNHCRGNSNCVRAYAVSAISSQPISMRRASEVPAPIS
jgi:hypothetical protein